MHLERTTREIFTLAGEEFNIGSPKQLAHILFEKLKLPPVRRTKTGYSTDADVLEQLALGHELPARIVEHRTLAKLKSTYADSLPTLINPTTGRIHTSFNQLVAATGRLSSSNPNVQNIPVRTELGRRIRAAFVPDPGWQFLAADYSQIELRILAHVSGEESLIEAFRRGEDIHRRTASEVFGVPLEAVTPEQRDIAKTTNFAVIYGVTAFGLSRGLDMSTKQAQEFLDRFFARHPKVKAYLARTVAEGRERGFVSTLLGRRRYLPELRSGNPNLRGFGERMATNAPIQGTAADLVKIAMVRMAQELDAHRLESRMLLQVHDELLFEVPPAELDRAPGARHPGDGVRHVVRRAAQGGREDRRRLGRGMKRFLLVGLTGGIATGKSTVTGLLANPSVRVVDADALAREVVEPGTPAHAQIVVEFGKDVLQPDGRLDRARLGEIVFPDPAKRKRLEAITHPAIRARFEKIMAELERQGFDGLLIWDAALLVESGGHKKMDKVVVVTTDPATQLQPADGARRLDRGGRARPHREPDAAGGEGARGRLRHRQLGHPRGDGRARARGLPRPPRGPAPAPGAAVSPRRNARAAVPRAPVYRSATRGRTRALGQHFLRDRSVVDRIVDLVAPTARDLVVEIGPGRGALTETLAARAGPAPHARDRRGARRDAPGPVRRVVARGGAPGGRARVRLPDAARARARSGRARAGGRQPPVQRGQAHPGRPGRGRRRPSTRWR